MRHNVTGKRLGRTTNQRKALMKGLAISIIEHERLQTTLVKAKELRKFVEPFITLGRKDTVANRRLAMARLGSKKAVEKLFSEEFSARFVGRPGGFTRILKTDHRLGDAADMAIIELVDYVLPEPKEAEATAE
ncbi:MULTISPECIES: 50S ribosomal protein L17 [Holophagaceae]|uniref:Large ribosomal subunit protein bL17 n=1 Tax=Mesoterricola silvestris TaxID=2927979 RepID=A0AA48GN90_9BACT|nr:MULTISPECIES: 50S ribosomal protein L17 [Holophagaceae]BDU71130.1 50S ribosomal protein L17 [Mesoterricola silvestris]